MRWIGRLVGRFEVFFRFDCTSSGGPGRAGWKARTYLPLPSHAIMGRGFDCDRLNFTQFAVGKVTDENGNDVSWSGIASTAVLYSMLALALLALFEAGRGKRSVYGRRIRKLRHRTPPPPGRWPLQWLQPVLGSLSDAEVRHMVGLDGFVAIRYLRLGLRCCLFCSFWGLAVLAPLYSRGGNEAVADSFRRFTMERLSDGSPALWAPAAFAAAFTVFVLHALKTEWELFVGWRVDFLVHGDGDAEGGPQMAYTVRIDAAWSLRWNAASAAHRGLRGTSAGELFSSTFPVLSLHRPRVCMQVRVESLPRELRSDGALFAYFDGLFPGKVHSASVQSELSVLQRALARRAAALNDLERALAVRRAQRAAKRQLVAPDRAPGSAGSVGKTRGEQRQSVVRSDAAASAAAQPFDASSYSKIIHANNGDNDGENDSEIDDGGANGEVAGRLSEGFKADAGAEDWGPCGVFQGALAGCRASIAWGLSDCLSGHCGWCDVDGEVAKRRAALDTLNGQVAELQGIPGL